MEHYQPVSPQRGQVSERVRAAVAAVPDLAAARQFRCGIVSPRSDRLPSPSYSPLASTTAGYNPDRIHARSPVSQQPAVSSRRQVHFKDQSPLPPSPLNNVPAEPSLHPFLRGPSSPSSPHDFPLADPYRRSPPLHHPLPARSDLFIHDRFTGLAGTSMEPFHGAHVFPPESRVPIPGTAGAYSDYPYPPALIGQLPLHAARLLPPPRPVPVDAHLLARASRSPSLSSCHHLVHDLGNVHRLSGPSSPGALPAARPPTGLSYRASTPDQVLMRRSLSPPTAREIALARSRESSPRLRSRSPIFPLSKSPDPQGRVSSHYSNFDYAAERSHPSRLGSSKPRSCTQSRSKSKSSSPPRTMVSSEVWHKFVRLAEANGIKEPDIGLLYWETVEQLCLHFGMTHPVEILAVQKEWQQRRSEDPMDTMPVPVLPPDRLAWPAEVLRGTTSTQKTPHVSALERDLASNLAAKGSKQGHCQQLGRRQRGARSSSPRRKTKYWSEKTHSTSSRLRA